MSGLDAFWQAIDAQIAELTTARSADDVLRILATERNPLGPGPWGGAAGQGFFAGSGGDNSVMDALFIAGWQLVAGDAIYFVMQAPDGSLITYIEGDVYSGNEMYR